MERLSSRNFSPFVVTVTRLESMRQARLAARIGEVRKIKNVVRKI
jgi:hypothetical protein